MPSEYVPLHKYLDGRYADTVVLGLAQIEDLIGVSLPAAAHVDEQWWSNGDVAGASPQSLCWTQAGRTATPNLRAQNVMFQRAA